MLLYLVSFLDRVNIGNARLYHMEEDLGLHGSQYQTAVSLLFVTCKFTGSPEDRAIIDMALVTALSMPYRLTGIHRYHLRNAQQFGDQAIETE